MSDVKISATVAAFLRENGSVKGDKLTISLSFLDSITSQGRSTSSEKAETFAKLLEGAYTRNDAGEAVLGDKVLSGVEFQDGEHRVVTVKQIKDLGLPETYATQPAVWSGIGEASELAMAHGLVSRRSSRVNDEGDLVIRIYFRAASDEDRAERATRRADKAARDAAKAKPSAPATETPASAPDAGPGES